MKIFKKQTRNRLIFSVVIVNVLLYILTGISLYNSLKHYKKQTVLSSQNLIKSLEINVAGVLDKIEISLFNVVLEYERNRANGEINPEILNSFLDKQKSQIPELDAMRIADSAGYIRYGTGVTQNNPSNIYEREYFQILFKNPDAGLVISKPVIGKISKKWVFMLAKRINKPDGAFDGVAYGTVLVDHFENIFKTFDIGEHGVISLRNSDLSLIVRTPVSPNAADTIGSKIVSDMAFQCIKVSPGYGVYESPSKFDGIYRQITYQKLPKTSLYLFVGQAREDYLEPWWKEALIDFVLLLLFSTLTIASTFLILKNRNKEIQNMLALAESENKLRELNATKDKFFSIIAHDLKNPLGSFRDVTKLLNDEWNNLNEEDKLEFVNLLKTSAENTYSLLENLLSWSTSQKGTMPFNLALCNLSNITEITIGLLSPLAENKDITIENNIPDELIINADANLITTIIRNLISNAIKFTSSTGKINVNCIVKDKEVRVAINDNGVGMDASTLEKIFRIDGQVTSLGTNQETGTGLGLILCKEFVERHAGRIWAESEVGKGTTFYFTLPH